ncbi:MAG: metallopeptidase family protein [Phycisphaerae bacterium]|nr:metallopeptidase family protein [Phycisphaerae bacterium]
MIRLSDEEFEELVDQAVESLPEEFDRYLENVLIEVEDLPDRRTLRDLELEHRGMLLGLYHGVPLTERSVEHSGRLPDRITIYKLNVEACCRSREEIVEQVRTTVLHEIGHHFGMDEDDLEAQGY